MNLRELLKFNKTDVGKAVDPAKEPTEVEKWWTEVLCSDHWRTVWKSMTNDRHFDNYNHPFKKWCWLHGFDISSEKGKGEVFLHITEFSFTGLGWIRKEILREIEAVDAIISDTALKESLTHSEFMFNVYLTSSDGIRKFSRSVNRLSSKADVMDQVGSLYLRYWHRVPHSQRIRYIYGLAKRQAAIEKPSRDDYDQMLNGLIILINEHLRKSTVLDTEITIEEQSVHFSHDGDKWVVTNKGLKLPVKVGGSPTTIELQFMPSYHFEGPEYAKQTAKVRLKSAQGKWLELTCNRDFEIIMVSNVDECMPLREFMIRQDSPAMDIFNVLTPLATLVKN